MAGCSWKIFERIKYIERVVVIIMDTMKKNVQFEYMRAIAIIGVVTIHTFNSAIIYFGKAATNLTLVLYDAVLKC